MFSKKDQKNAAQLNITVLLSLILFLFGPWFYFSNRIDATHLWTAYLLLMLKSRNLHIKHTWHSFHKLSEPFQTPLKRWGWAIPSLQRHTGWDHHGRGWRGDSIMPGRGVLFPVTIITRGQRHFSRADCSCSAEATESRISEICTWKAWSQSISPGISECIPSELKVRSCFHLVSLHDLIYSMFNINI